VESTLLNNVIQLLNLGVGDTGRLEHIKESLEKNKTLYFSDRGYIENMIEQHIGKQENRSDQIKNPNSDESIMIRSSKSENNIKNTQVKEVLIESGKYEKELPVRKNIIGSYIPGWAFIVMMNLGMKYGTLALLSNIALVWGGGIIGSVLISADDLYIAVIGLVLILSLFPLHGLITWYFIKKHNARVRANKSNVSSS